MPWGRLTIVGIGWYVVLMFSACLWRPWETDGGIRERIKIFMRSSGGMLQHAAEGVRGRLCVTDAMRDTSYMYLHRSSRGRSVRQRRFGRHFMRVRPLIARGSPAGLGPERGKAFRCHPLAERGRHFRPHPSITDPLWPNVLVPT